MTRTLSWLSGCSLVLAASMFSTGEANARPPCGHRGPHGHRDLQKTEICHHGHTLCVARPALAHHAAHGDALCACESLTSEVEDPISLATARAKLVGAEPGDQAGAALAGGDFDGDGVGDALIGAMGAGAAGAAYIVFGPFAGTIDLDAAGAIFVGEGPSDGAGSAVAAGDFDGDGTDDVLIGALSQDAVADDEGAAYVVYGPIPEGFTLDLRFADAKLTGEHADDSAGQAVASAGDVDGDGVDDLLVGAPGEDGVAAANGAAYLLYGPVAGTVSLAAADAKFQGTRMQDFAGRSVASAGDVDGDGFDDVLIGVQSDDTAANDAGAVALFLGPVNGTHPVTDADAFYTGEAAADLASVVAPAGDVDGDGLDDFLVGASGHDARGAGSGAAYLVYGADVSPGTHSLAGAGAKFMGEAAGDAAGVSVAGAGDLDGDGFDDVLVGAEGERTAGAYSGAAYVIFGPMSGAIGLEAAGRKYLGESVGSLAGGCVASIPDVDGDGLADALVGAGFESSGGGLAGAAYLVRIGPPMCPAAAAPPAPPPPPKRGCRRSGAEG